MTTGGMVVLVRHVCVFVVKHKVKETATKITTNELKGIK